MLGILYALVTVIAWGTWLAPSQTIPFKNQQIKTFYVAAANLILATVIYFTQNIQTLTFATFWPPFIGGLIWSVGGLCAFTATAKLGMARAFGIWAPLNIIVSILWGAVLFHEFLDLSALNQILLFVSLVIIVAGVLMIILPRDHLSHPLSRRDVWIGVLGAIGAGVLWGSYYLPIKSSQVSLWVLTLPLSVGIFVGSGLLAVFSRQSIGLSRPMDYVRVSATGLLWGIGNYGMLLLVDTLGAGKGFTISQLSVVVNALIGVFLLKNPSPRSRAAVYILVGSVLATLGGIILGNLK
jgi:glucose uptake protein